MPAVPKYLSFIIAVALVVSLVPTLSAVGEEIVTLTTIMPSQDTVRAKRGAIGLTYRDQVTLPDADIGDSNLLVEGKVGIGTTNPEMWLTIGDYDTRFTQPYPDGGILAVGQYGVGADLQASGWSTKLIWYPKKAAFRAGFLSEEGPGDLWDDVNIGGGSVAFGISTKASGAASTALGAYSFAEGNSSTAIGYFTTASGKRSVAIGEGIAAGPADNTITIGHGAEYPNYLENNVANSLMVGFNSDTPTLFVGPASGAGTVGSVGIGTTSIDAVLNVEGTVSLFGTWTDKDSAGSTLVKMANYRAGSDGFVCARSATGTDVIIAYMDSNNPPATVMMKSHSSGTDGITLPVRKGDYWRISGPTLVSIRWLPLGSGTCVKQ